MDCFEEARRRIYGWKDNRTVCFIAVAAIVMVRTKGNIAKPNANALSDEEVVKRLERDWADAAAHNDADKVNRILAEDFVGNWADGSHTTKKEELGMLRSGTEKYEMNEIVETTVRVFGHTAIVSGKQTETSVIGGKNATGTYNFTDIFLKRGAGWQTVASQTPRPIRYGTKCI